MNQLTLVTRLRSEIIDGNMEIYHDLFTSSISANVSDPHWKSALEFYATLNESQKSILFRIIRHAIVDTMSTLLGVLDGVSWLEGQTDGFVLTTEGSTEKLNEGLQDLFLGMEEIDPH